MNKWYSFLYLVISAFLRVFHPWEAVGLEGLPEGGVLVCGNHTTLGDPLYVLCAVGARPQFHIMAKQELVNIPVFGPLITKAGVIGVKRGKADVGAIKKSLRVLKDGGKLLLFPEGTRVREGEAGVGHTGAAMLAAKADVPILPVYIQPKKRWFKKTTVVFGQPYKPEYPGKKPTPEDYQRITDDLMARIVKLGEQA